MDGEFRLCPKDLPDLLLSELHDLATPRFPKEMVDRRPRHVDRHIEGRRLLRIPRDGGTRDKDQAAVRRERGPARGPHQQMGSIGLDEHGRFDGNLPTQGLARLQLPFAFRPAEAALRGPEVQVVQAPQSVEEPDVLVLSPSLKRLYAMPSPPQNQTKSIIHDPHPGHNLLS